MALIGAICGDIVGSIYEFNNIKTKDFELFGKGCNFTDDTAMSMAVAEWVIYGGDVKDYLIKYGNMYKLPLGGYGGRFRQWLFEDEEKKPYNSFGNGSAMRVSAVGWAYSTLGETRSQARKSAEVTHNHAEGIKGAEATASAIFLLRNGRSKDDVKNYLTQKFNYNLNRTVDSIRPTYQFDVTCQGTVPEAFICFYEAESFEDAIRNAISLGGDSDTLACICGAMAEAHYGVPDDIKTKVLSYLPLEFVSIIEQIDIMSKNSASAVSGETVQILEYMREMKDLAEVKYDRPIIPIRVDFDGTIVEHAFPRIGKANPLAIETMKEWTEKYNVGWILDTMRSDKVLDDAVKYIIDNGIKLYGVGKNPTQDLWTNSPKCYGLFSIDDVNVGTPLIYEDNKRPYVDWKGIREILIPILDNITERKN